MLSKFSTTENVREIGNIGKKERAMIVIALFAGFIGFTIGVGSMVLLFTIKYDIKGKQRKGGSDNAMPKQDKA